MDIIPELPQKAYVCPKCGGHMNIDTSAICASIPPQYRLVCDNCHYLDFVDCREVRYEKGRYDMREEMMKEVEGLNRVQEFEMRLDNLCGEFSDLTYNELHSSFEFYADKYAKLKELE